jgi:hypothetical protein
MHWVACLCWVSCFYLHSVACVFLLLVRLVASVCLPFWFHLPSATSICALMMVLGSVGDGFVIGLNHFSTVLIWVCGFVRGHSGILDHSGIVFESCWDRFVIVLDSFRSRCGIVSESAWDLFGTIPGRAGTVGVLFRDGGGIFLV